MVKKALDNMAHVGLAALVLLGTGMPLAAGEPKRALGPQDIRTFLTALRGPWQGQAVVTPRGPLPYDISFAPINTDGIGGTANPGAALHHWHFHPRGDYIELRFLTTFGGNTEPVFLRAVHLRGNTLIFNTDRRDYLSVQITPGKIATRIAVLLRNEPHVEIRLQRAGGQTPRQ
ncbi:MAG: hypothetical protein JSW10_06575 [Pseudomonadota bacterium]|nr:MAG: hypothetical protein JSW10_06575 [Pseudomonadota bacterium]